jgi:hypothetical protein
LFKQNFLALGNNNNNINNNNLNNNNLNNNNNNILNNINLTNNINQLYIFKERERKFQKIATNMFGNFEFINNIPNNCFIEFSINLLQDKKMELISEV